MASYPFLSQAPTPVEVELGCDNILCIVICQLTVVIYLHILPEGPDYSVEDFCLKPVEKGLADTNNAETAKELQHLSKLATIDNNLPIVNKPS